MTYTLNRDGSWFDVKDSTGNLVYEGTLAHCETIIFMGLNRLDTLIVAVKPYPNRTWLIKDYLEAFEIPQKVKASRWKPT